jgi:hypothetical protein
MDGSKKKFNVMSQQEEAEEPKHKENTTQRVPSPAPLFASSPPSSWTHPARKVSEESSSSASSEDNGMTSTIGEEEGDAEVHHGSAAAWWVDATSQVPLYYQLSPTSSFIEGATAATVSSRISHCLAQRSLVAMYSGPWAHVTALDGTAFTIRLFRGPTGGVVVELQLVKGNPLTFHKLCIIVLEAAKGNPYLHLPDHAQPPPSKKSKKQPLQEEEALVVSLERAYELLEKDRIDANRLGMEMLVLLTDAENQNSDYVAEAILLGRDRVGSHVYDRVFDLLPLITMEEDDDRREEVEMLRPLAFQVLRNTLVMLAQGTDLRNMGIMLPEWMVESLLPVLHMEFTERDPHRAYLAVEAWMALVTLNEQAFSITAQDEQLLPALEQLRSFGLTYHAALAEASKQAIHILHSYRKCKTEKE